MADPNAVRALRDLLGRNDLVSHLVDVCMAISLTRSDDPTPHQVLRDAISSFAFSETEWVGVVRPHLRSLLDTPADVDDEWMNASGYWGRSDRLTPADPDDPYAYLDCTCDGEEGCSYCSATPADRQEDKT